jgi:hypothetical protein
MTLTETKTTVRDWVFLNGGMAAPIDEVEEALERLGELDRWRRCIRLMHAKCGSPIGVEECAAFTKELHRVFLNVVEGRWDLEPLEAVYGL